MRRPFATVAAATLATALGIASWASPFLRGSEVLTPPGEAAYGHEVTAAVDPAFLLSAMGAQRAVMTDLPLAGEGHADVELEAFSPFAAGCTVVEMTDSGPVEHPLPTGRRYFRARVLAPSAGYGLFAFERDTFSGFLQLEGTLYIYGVKGDGAGRRAASCRFSPEGPPPEYMICQNEILPEQAPEGETPMPKILPFERGTWPLQANLAIEMDNESYGHFGSVHAAVTYAADLMAAGSVIYEADVQTTVGIINVRVWSTSSDPYRSGTDTSGLLTDLRNEYQANMSALDRASVMLLSRRNMGGIAYVQALCSKSYGYAVCGIEGTHTYPTTAYTWDVNCTTHELGHNFKSHHTHCYGPSDGLADWVDKCYKNEGGCYSGTVVNPPMNEKTLMSYCHLLSPYQVTLTFIDKYDYTRNVIRAGAEGASCLVAPACAYSCTPVASSSLGAPPMTVNFYGNPVATTCSGSPTWSWNFGDGGTSTQENPSHTYPGAGTYNWSVTTTLDGKTCSGAGTITVTPCTLSCTATVPTTASASSPISFASTATVGPTCVNAVVYDWDFGDGTVHGNSANVVHVYSTAGTYNWTLTVSVDGVVCTKSGTITVAPICILTCEATVPATGQTGTNVRFQATATATDCSGSPSYSWNFGDGLTGGGQNANHTYAAAGNYHWRLTVTVGGSTCMKDGYIDIAEAPPTCTVSCTASASPSSGTAPLTVAFGATATATNCTGAPAYAWAFGDGATSTEQNPSHTYDAPGSYAWTLTVTVEDQTCTQTGTVTVAFPCTVTCTASAAPASGPAPLTVAFAATATPDHCSGTPTYAWAFGDGATSTEQNPSHTYDATGNYAWTLTVTVDGKTCSQAGSVTVGEPCTLACDATVPASSRAGDPVAFAATATPDHCSGSPTFAWAFGDGATSAEQNPSHTYAQAGSFAWTLTVTVEGGTCTKTGTVEVSEACTLTCDATASPTSGTAPLAVTFAGSATATNCIGDIAYSWTFGDGASSSEQSPSHTYAAGGTYTWILTVTAEGETCTKTGTVEVSEPCALTCDAAADPASGTAPLAVAFSSSATASNCAGAVTYAWAFGDGETASEQNPFHTYTGAGTFTWTLTATADGQTCTRTGTVTVNPGVPGDANGDGVVSIGEVQQAINMFLGTQPPGNGVDCNGDGAVSIGEVQKVINAFLGLPSSC